MQIPLQITFHNLDRSEAVEARVREKAEALERFHQHIISCRVAIEARHRRSLQGKLYRVRVDVSVPGREIVVGRSPDRAHQHEDVYVALRDAFDAVRRRLEDGLRKARGRVKSHVVPDHGRVIRLLPDRDCGFIRTSEGEEVYFHRNSAVSGSYDRLSVGDEVRFVAQERESEKGWQASTVVPIGKHHLPPAVPERA